MNDRSLKRCGFTLIELLVVIAIIAILAAILFPVFARARSRAQQTACLSNLKQISIAFRQYNDDNDNRFMPAAGFPNFQTGSFVRVLQPYVKTLDVFICPSAPRKYSATSYNDQGDPNAADTGWSWNDQHGTYGNNIVLSGYNVEAGQWTFPPVESAVKDPARLVYLMDSRWVDLVGAPGWLGRIGRARFRHQGIYKAGSAQGGGLNVVFAEGHASFIRAESIEQYPASTDGLVMWTPK